MRKCTSVFFINDPHSTSCEQNDKRALFLKTFLVNNGITAKFYIQLSIQNEVHVLNLEKDINKKYMNYMRKLYSQKSSVSDSEDFSNFGTESDLK